jgi:hypothetical protein
MSNWFAVWINATWNWLNRKSALLIICLGFSTLLFAFIGTFLALGSSEAGAKLSFFDQLSTAIYESVQATLRGDGPNANQFNVWIGAARITSVLLLVLIGIQAVAKLFKESFIEIRLALAPKENYLVCGLGRLGYQVTLDHLKQKHFVVVIEIDSENPNIRLAENAGAIVIIGDASNTEVLRLHAKRNPTKVFLFTGDDHANLAIFSGLKKHRSDFLSRGKTVLSPLVCDLHIGDSRLEQAVRWSIEQAPVDESLVTSDRIKLFDIATQTARQLIIEELTRVRPTQSSEVALYVIFGDGQQTDAMIRQIAEFAHFENLKRSRILVLTPDAKAKCRSILNKWGRLSPAIILDRINDVFFEGKHDDWSSRELRPAQIFQTDHSESVEYVANVQFCEFEPESVSVEVVNKIVELSDTENVRPVVLFCFEDDGTNFRLSSELNYQLSTFHGINRDLGFLKLLATDPKEKYLRQREFEIPIFAFLPQNDTLRETLLAANPRFPVRTFGEVGEGLQRVNDSHIEEIAMEIAWDYDAKYSVDSVPKDEYKSIWQKKSTWIRHSNIAAAIHTLVKVQILGYRLSQDTNSELANMNAIGAEQQALMGMTEHNRWLAERLLLGWRHGTTSEQPPARPSLCAKDSLEADELKKDFEQMKAVINLFRNYGYQLAKNP